MYYIPILTLDFKFSKKKEKKKKWFLRRKSQRSGLVFELSTLSLSYLAVCSFDKLFLKNCDTDVHVEIIESNNFVSNA